jgi:hypothetical protein
VDQIIRDQPEINRNVKNSRPPNVLQCSTIPTPYQLGLRKTSFTQSLPNFVII